MYRFPRNYKSLLYRHPYNEFLVFQEQSKSHYLHNFWTRYLQKNGNPLVFFSCVVVFGAISRLLSIVDKLGFASLELGRPGSSQGQDAADTQALSEQLRRKPRLLPPRWRGGWWQWPPLGRKPHLLSTGCCPPTHPFSLFAQRTAPVTKVPRARRWDPGLFTYISLLAAFGNGFLGLCLVLTPQKSNLQAPGCLTCFSSSRAFQVPSFHCDPFQHR